MTEAAHGALVELKAVMSQTIPPYPPIQTVCEILNRFSSEIQSFNSTKDADVVFEFDSIQPPPLELVAICWTMFCDTGEQGVREFSAEAALVREATLRAMHAFCTLVFPGPDSNKLELVHFVMISQALDSRIPEECQILAFKILRYINVQNEENREILTSFIPAIPALVRLIRRNQPSPIYMREWCAAVKSMLLKDDIHVAYNKSDERKRILFQENTLRHLSQYLNDYDDQDVLNSIVVILGSMACHDDYCLSMHAGGVLPGLVKIFDQFHTNVDHAKILEIAFSCTAFMTLRCPCHCLQFLREGGVKIFLELMTKQMKHAGILKGACSTFRNVAASGSKEGRKLILQNEDFQWVMQEIEISHPEMHDHYTKPILRDLGFPVSPKPEIDISTNSDEFVSSSSGGSDSLSDDPAYATATGIQLEGIDTGTAAADLAANNPGGQFQDNPELPRISEWLKRSYYSGGRARSSRTSTVPSSKEEEEARTASLPEPNVPLPLTAADKDEADRKVSSSRRTSSTSDSDNSSSSYTGSGSESTKYSSKS